VLSSLFPVCLYAIMFVPVGECVSVYVCVCVCVCVRILLVCLLCCYWTAEIQAHTLFCLAQTVTFHCADGSRVDCVEMRSFSPGCVHDPTQLSQLCQLLVCRFLTDRTRSHRRCWFHRLAFSSVQAVFMPFYLSRDQRTVNPEALIIL